MLMAPIPAPSVPISQVGRAAHDIGLAGLLGGNLFGRLALHPSVTEISDKSERGKLVNAAWRRYGIVNSLSLVAVLVGWIGARADEGGRSSVEPLVRRRAAPRTGQGCPRRRRRGHRSGDRGPGHPVRARGSCRWR